MRHPKAIEWEDRLKTVFDRIDDELEETYGHRYPLHPARAPRNSTANKEQDGLFDLGATFSAGYGSQHGPGYVLEIRMATLNQVPPAIRTEIETLVIDRLRILLPKAFPGTPLEIERDGSVYKIHGDLRLGMV